MEEPIKQKRRRGVVASRIKLSEALFNSDIGTQAALANRIADLEGISTAPKNLVSKVFQEHSVQYETLERIANALGTTAASLLADGQNDLVWGAQGIEDRAGVASNDAPLNPGKPELTATSQSARDRFVGFIKTNLPAFVAVISIGTTMVALTAWRTLQLGATQTAQETSYTDFSFASGKPVTGFVVIDGVIVRLSSSNTEPFSHGLRDQLNTEPSYVTMEFSQPIKTFQINVSYVLKDYEFLTDFSMGLPSKTTGTLEIIDDLVTSNISGDDGYGSLIWENLDTFEVSFCICNLPDKDVYPALWLESFAFDVVNEKNKSTNSSSSIP